MRMTETDPTWQPHRLALLAVLALFLLLCAAYALTTPFYEPPDEAGHFLYIHHLIEEQTLPRLPARIAGWNRSRHRRRDSGRRFAPHFCMC